MHESNTASHADLCVGSNAAPSYGTAGKVLSHYEGKCCVCGAWLRIHGKYGAIPEHRAPRGE